MTLDDLSWEDMARRQEEQDREQRHAEMAERDELESVEAEEAKWQRIFRQSAAEREPVHYKTVGQGYDTRLFGGEAS